MNEIIDTLGSEIRKIYEINPGLAEASIEELLKGELEGLSREESLAVLKHLISNVSENPLKREDDAAAEISIDAGIIEKFLPMILGRRVSNLPPDIVAEKLGSSLNTIFDSLNQLIGLINSTLGNAQEQDETIRHIIGTSIENAVTEKSLEEHLGQIRKAFLVSQKAFKEAAKNVLSNVLAVLDPKQMEPSQSGLKIGPLKKAESFEIYEEKYKKCRKWFDSGRFIDDLSVQFEKNCQKFFNENRG